MKNISNFLHIKYVFLVNSVINFMLSASMNIPLIHDLSNDTTFLLHSCIGGDCGRDRTLDGAKDTRVGKTM